MTTTTQPGTTPALAGDPPDEQGVEGNARLTSATGSLLTLLLLVEGLTILSIRQLITIHVFVGMVLVAPVALKIATTMYRFGRYYLHDVAYVRRGPPHPVLRVLGPLLVLATVALLATGILLLTRRGGDGGTLLTLHKVSFFGWVVLMTVHFLCHVLESSRLTWQDWRPTHQHVAARGRPMRLVALVATLLVGVALAAVVTPGNSWSNRPRGDQHHDGSGPDGAARIPLRPAPAPVLPTLAPVAAAG